MIIPFHRPQITNEEIESVVDSLRRGWITMGEKTIEFEKQFSSYLGMPSAVAVNSCTAALHLALKAIGLKENDEVLVPVMTFASAAETVLYFNARPVFCDINPQTHLIMPEDIERNISPKTKAIIPVHYGGQPADIDEIRLLAGKEIAIIDDAAHSLPAWYKGEIIGRQGDITCFSFYATKTLTTGEGGMAVTANEEWAEKMRRLRLHGISSDAWKRYTAAGSWKYDVVEVGYKYNTTDMNSALGLGQLKRVEEMRKARERIAGLYDASFGNCPGILPYCVKSDRISAWHLYPLRLDLDRLSVTRDEFIEEMKTRGISTSVHFIPMHHFTYYKRLGLTASDYPGAEWVYERLVSLPIYPSMTDAEITYVIDNVIDIVSRRQR